eukprot:gb/GEZN01024597.1/.p1 GENE.gb/GEZN01024597.1/~~gb/GEZN01024597.1/.p1  ORF type:complete len:142 (-),score=17.82 gb/GEZN01024597.1/:139-504(-)
MSPAWQSDLGSLDEGLGIDGLTSQDCVVCLSDPRNTALFPCRHMCLCEACANILRNQTNRCPICRCIVESVFTLSLARPGTPIIPLPNAEHSREEDGSSVLVHPPPTTNRKERLRDEAVEV